MKHRTYVKSEGEGMKMGNHFKEIVAVTLASVALLAVFTSCTSKTAEDEEEKIYEGTIEEKIDAFYADHEETAAGMMVGVFDENGIIYEGYYGYSNIAEGIEMDENTVVDWGSSTKTLVWVSVMQLWEQGKIDLEADVREYLPEGFLTNLRYDKPVRMIDLMNHRAGFQEYFTDMFLDPGREYISLEEALLQDPPPQIFEPDTITAYSNWGVALAGYIVERISGESFADYVHENIFEPLGMKDSALEPDLMDDPDVRRRRDELVCYSGTVPVGSAFYLIQLYPAGSCVSTLKDYIRYASCFIQDEFPLFEDQATFDVMMSATSYFGNTDVVKNAHGIWALPYGSDTYGHGGNTQACSSYITFDPVRRTGAVVMTNQANETVFNYDMMTLIYGESERDLPVSSEFKSGLYHSARTILEGHFKVYGIGYITEDELEGWEWTYNENDGIPKIEGTYGDYYYVSTGKALFEIILFYGWIVSLVFAGASLIVKIIRTIVRKIRKSPKKSHLGILTGFMSLTELVCSGLGLSMALMVTSWMPQSSYSWIFPMIGILAIVLLALTVCAVIGFCGKTRKSAPVIRKIYNIFAILFAVLTVIFIIYIDIWH